VAPRPTKKTPFNTLFFIIFFEFEKQTKVGFSSQEFVFYFWKYSVFKKMLLANSLPQVGIKTALSRFNALLDFC
jgi:hypothetical protein